MGIVERFMQQKDLGDFQPKRVKLPAKLLECVRAESSSDQGADMLGTEFHLDGPVRVQRERHVANGAEVMADRATFALRADDQRIAFTQGESFEAIWAIGFAGDPIPVARIVGAAATGDLRKNAIRRRQANAFHRSSTMERRPNEHIPYGLLILRGVAVPGELMACSTRETQPTSTWIALFLRG